MPGCPYTQSITPSLVPCWRARGQSNTKQQMIPKSSGVGPKFQSPTRAMPACLVAQRGALRDSQRTKAPPSPGSGHREHQGLADSHPPSGLWQGPEQYLQPTGCHALYLSSVSVETLSGALAVQKAISTTLEREVLPTPTVVHFRVTEHGITLTDVQRK